MTEVGTISISGPSDAHPVAGEETARAAEHSLSTTTYKAVLARTGARVGLIWIGFIIFLAVFAPLLANSHPIWMVQNGRSSSPLMRFLSKGDVVLQIVFWTACIRVIFRKRDRLFRTILLTVSFLLCLIALVFVNPPEVETNGPEAYRVDLAAGKIQHALFVPLRYSPDDHLNDEGDVRHAAPSSSHPLGTTNLRADVLSNMIYASRIALSIGFISTGIAVVIGVVAGGIMGYYAGWVDLIGMRISEVFQAIPTLLLLLCFVAAFGRNLYIMMAIIGFTSWVGYATFIRAEFLSLRDRDFVHAARAAGIPTWSILFRHMLPNGITPVLVSASFGVAGAILIESTLSFLGIGLVGEASWGGLLNQALGEGGSFYWWIALYPGLAIFLTVFAYNLIGEALRDALDPKLLKN